MGCCGSEDAGPYRTRIITLWCTSNLYVLNLTSNQKRSKSLPLLSLSKIKHRGGGQRSQSKKEKPPIISSWLAIGRVDNRYYVIKI